MNKSVGLIAAVALGAMVLVGCGKAKLDASSEEAQLHSAEADLQLARADLERARDLAARNVVSKAELDSAESFRTTPSL